MKLQTMIMRRIVCVAALCLIAVALYVMQQANAATQQRQHSIAEALGRQAEFQLLKISSDFDLAERFPDWEVIYRSDSFTGLCARFVTPQGATFRNLCRGPESVACSWPDWFDFLYRKAFEPGSEVVRQVVFRNTSYGKVVVVAPPEVSIARAWRDLSMLSGLALVTLAAALLMLYATLGKALRPVDTMLLLLDDMAGGDLSKRIPATAITELQGIAAGVNRLASNLEHSLKQQTDLSMKLLSVQEQEREQLARDLHDEFGQHLAGINAMAASIAYTARSECPELLVESENIIHAVGHLLELLRGMLIRLRPPEIERMNLRESLDSLIISWDTYSRGKIHIDLELDVRLGSISGPIAVHLYRIVQECLTNAAKHGDATRVQVRLAYVVPAEDRSEHSVGDEVELVVEDNGRGLADGMERQAGVGLPGMRERVAVLKGTMQLYSATAGGLGVRVLVPVDRTQGIAGA